MHASDVVPFLRARLLALDGRALSRVLVGVGRMTPPPHAHDALCGGRLLYLHRLRDTVAPEVPEDPTRHLALTSAAQAYLDGDRETGVRKFATQDKNFYAGYTMDNLMADTRARLGTVAHFVPHFALRNTSSSRSPHLEPHLLAALTPALTRAALPSCSLSPLKLPRCLSCPLPLFAHVFGSPACSLPRDPSHDNLTCYLSLSLSLSLLAMALHTAGLTGTQAARDAMMTVKGTLLPRKDMFTSAQLGSGGGLIS